MTVTNNTKGWIITSAIVGIILILVSIFFYNNFFRQTNGPLIETVPPDAAFVFEINDNEQFVKTSASLMPFLTELFALDGLAGYESFLEKMPRKDGPILVSGFVNDDKIMPLFSTRMDERYFKSLLKLLQIDPRNNVKFEGYEIYSYGTHYKDFKFVFHNNVFSASEDVDLLKRSIVQLKYPKGLSSDKAFRQLRTLVDKNVKQNWLLMNPSKYAEFLKTKSDEHLDGLIDELANLTTWCAYQVRFSDAELFLSGYLDTENARVQQFANGIANSEFPQRVVPITAQALTIVDDENYRDLARNWGEESESYLRLAPVQSVFFSLPGDSCNYHYCAVKIDTSAASFASFFAEEIDADSIQKNTPKSVYDCLPVDYAEKLSYLFRNDKYGYMMQVKDYYLLADTVTTLEYYKKLMRNTNYVETGNLYKFAASNTPSDAVCTFFFFNQNDNLKKQMDNDAARKSCLNDLKAISFSFAAPSQKIVGSNVYLKF